MNSCFAGGLAVGATLLVSGCFQSNPKPEETGADEESDGESGTQDTGDGASTGTSNETTSADDEGSSSATGTTASTTDATSATSSSSDSSSDASTGSSGTGTDTLTSTSDGSEESGDASGTQDSSTTTDGESTDDGSTSVTTTSETTSDGSSGESDTGPSPVCGDGIVDVGELCLDEYAGVDVINPPWKLAVGDLDNNGSLDLVTADTPDNETHIYAGDGEGSFDQLTGDAFGPPYAVAVGDFGTVGQVPEGMLDIAFAFSDDAAVAVVLNDGAPTLTEGQSTSYPVDVSPTALAVGRIDADAYADIVVVNKAGSWNLLTASNTGDGTFSVATAAGTWGGFEPSDVALADLNHAGGLDLIITLRSNNLIERRLGNGAGGFAAQQILFATGETPEALAVGDIDGDGDPDVAVVSSGDSTLNVLLGSGNGSFADKVDYEVGSGPTSVALGDLTNDGLDDVVVCNDVDANVMVFVALGGSLLDEPLVLELETGRAPKDVVLGDFNEDEVLDIAVAQSSYPVGGDAQIGIFLSNP